MSDVAESRWPEGTPGSAKAVGMGCYCAIMDNGYGRGYLGGMTDPDTGEVMFVVTSDCPIHGTSGE